MRIAVCVKWVPDPEYPFQATIGGVHLDAPGLTYLANPLDMVACEAGVRLKELAGGTVKVVTVGPEAAESALRSGLALGADSATRVEFEGDGLVAGDPTARLLAAVLASDPPDVIICGARSSDSGSGTVPVFLAERLDRPLVTNVVSLSGVGPLEVERRMEGGRRQLLQVHPPAAITVEESLCDPRYPSVLARRKADRTPIEVFTPGQLGVDLPDRSVTLIRLQGPRPLAARLVSPPAGLLARGRLAFVMAGGPDQKRSSRRLEGPTPLVVDQLLAYLDANGVTGSDGRRR
ncbi:MAG: hypothetical protein C3F10_06070 [Dehalococcoidia bacterium]|nr:MAG: hypothetical protein C3F10_06070 [Dehalococcoidia bacterium]